MKAGRVVSSWTYMQQRNLGRTVMPILPTRGL